VEADILSKRWGAGGAAAAPSAAGETLLAAAGPAAGELRDVAAAQRKAADEAAGARQHPHRAATRSFPSLDRSVAAPGMPVVQEQRLLEVVFAPHHATAVATKVTQFTFGP
jgi:hypothetical protein